MQEGGHATDDVLSPQEIVLIIAALDEKLRPDDNRLPGRGASNPELYPFYEIRHRLKRRSA